MGCQKQVKIVCFVVLSFNLCCFCLFFKLNRMTGILQTMN